jgi:zinc/manganese transport system substrate-binding protein
VLPALTTQAQPSAGETQELVDLITEEDVNAVFPEAGVNAALEETVAEETGAEIGDELWADTLGPDGSSGETYLEATAHNANALADGFAAGQGGCDVSA